MDVLMKMVDVILIPRAKGNLTGWRRAMRAAKIEGCVQGTGC